MDAAVWGAIGTVVGGVLTMLGNWVVTRTQTRQSETAERRRHDDIRRQELRAVYLRLLLVCRQMRTESRIGHSLTQGEVDRLQVELSSCTYEIALIASPEVTSAAERMAGSVRDYLREARRVIANPQPRGTAADEHEKLRAVARDDVDRFIEVARTSFEAAS